MRACEIAWVRGRLVVASTARSGSGSVLQLFRVTSAGRVLSVTPLAVAGRIEALDANESAIVAAVAWPGTATRLLASATVGTASREIGSLPEVLLQLPAGRSIDAVSIR